MPKEQCRRAFRVADRFEIDANSREHQCVRRKFDESQTSDDAPVALELMPEQFEEKLHAENIAPIFAVYGR
jgi:hypothetical protein